MDFDFDYAAARRDGYSDEDILNGLASKGRLNFDLNSAMKDGHSASDIMDTLIARQPQPEKSEPSSLLRRAGDVGISALKGAISVPETAVGLADLVSGGAAGRAAESIGFRPKEAKATLNELYSPEQKAANQRVAEAQGFTDTAGAMLSNPSTLLQTGVESLPLMGAGGVVGRGGMALAPRIGAVAAGAIGEGAVGAGQAAEQVRQQSADGSLSLGQIGASIGSGIGTGIFGAVGGRLAQKLGIADIDTALVQAGSTAGSSKGVIRRLIEGGVSEGVFEELPQSIQEQIWQNAAMGKPLLDGVPENAAQGLLAGGLFGSIAGAALPGRAPTQNPPEQQPGETPLLTNSPDPLIAFPDGSVGRQSDVDGFISSLPENERLSARARLMGMAPQPYTEADILQAQSVDEALAVAERALEEGTPEFRAQRDTEIDGAWQAYLGDAAARRQQEFDAAEEARRVADIPAMQAQQQDQVVDQAAALTDSQGFDQPQPTAIELAMQRAQADRASRLAEAQQRATIEGQQQGDGNANINNRGETGSRLQAGDVADAATGSLGATDRQFAGTNAATTNEPPTYGQGTAVPNDARAPVQTDGGQPSAAASADLSPVSAEDVARAREILSAAGVTGNERMAALRSIRTGENTLDDLIDAHPPKEVPDGAAAGNDGLGVDVGGRSNRPAGGNEPALGRGSVPAGVGLDGIAGQPDRAGGGRNAANLPDAGRAADSQPALSSVTGRQIDSEWNEFASQSGTLNIDRAEMPQVKAEHRGALVNYLNARGIEHETTEVPAGDLKPTQREFSNKKVQQARDFQGGDRSILISSDNHVLDGHHQWLAKLGAGEPVKVIRLDAPIRELLDQVKEFPSSEVSTGAEQRSGQDRRAVPREDDRRAALSKPISEIDSLEESNRLLELARDRLLTSDRTGLRNFVAWNEREPKAYMASVDVDSLKWVNDNMGHPAGDKLLAAVADSLRAAGFGNDAFHISGDEFYVQGNNESALRTRLKLAMSNLKGRTIAGNGLTYKGAGFSYGIGQDQNTAERGLHEHKQSREQAGERAARGERPDGVIQAYVRDQVAGREPGNAGQAERDGSGAAPQSGQDDQPVSDTPRESASSSVSGGMTAADVNRAIVRLRAKWLGFTRINVVQSVSDLPANLAARSDESSEGYYDPASKTVYLIADNLASPERAAWVAAHEVSHAGLRMLHDKSINEALNVAGANRFIKELANAIQQDRTDVSGQIAVEEAIAELSAAIETDDFTALEDRYGVTVPSASMNGVRGAVARVIEAVKRFFAAVTGQAVAQVSDADVRELIGQQQDAVEGRVGAERAPDGQIAAASTIPNKKRTIEVDGVRHPITDSNGKLVAPTFDEQVEFWRNYDGPVDDDGHPVMDSAPRASRAPAAPQGEERMPKWAEGLNPEQQAALRKSGAIYTEKTMRQKVAELKDGALKKLQYGILDQFAPIKDKVGRIPYVLARMAKNADGTLEALMLYGRPHLDAEGGMLVDTTKKGFIETMQVLDGEHDRFFSWLAGRRAEQLKKEGRENLFTDDDISALSTLNQGRMKNGDSREAVYLRAQKDVAELNKSVLDIAETSGLIDPESRKVWASDFYVPFYRVMEEGITGPSIKSGLVNQKSIKKLKGGTNNLGDLTQNMLMNWSTLLTASAKNRAAKATLTAAADMGIATEADETTIRQMGKAANTKAVSYMENGVNRWHVVEDDQLLAAISALEFSGYNNDAMKAMTWFKNALTRAITVSPFFKVRNLIRDSVSTIAVSNASYNPLANWKNGYSLLRDDAVRAQMVAGGGIYRFGTYMEGNRAENVKRLIDDGVPEDTILNTADKFAKFARKLWRSYEEVGDLSENLNRAALYQKRRAEGASHLEASFEARDLMDFGLSGAWAGVRALNQILPFFNARLQGLYKLGRGYNDDPKRMGYVVGAVSLASVALLLAYKDDDDFKKRSDADRNNYWWFKVGGIAYRIPKPFEIGAAGSAIEHMTALMVDQENTNAERFANQIGELINGQLAMNPIPQVFRPLIDIYSNKDAFSGRPIESMAMQRLRPEDRYTYNTSELARMLSKSGVFVDPVSLVSGTGVKQLSPVQIDSLVRGYFSGVGTLAVSSVDGLLHHTLIDRGEALPAPLRTLTGSFAEELPTNSSRYVDSLYKTAQDIEQTYASYQNAIKNGDLEKARALQRDEGEALAKYHFVESLKKNETRIGQAIQRTINSKELSGEQKEQQVRYLKAAQDRIARQLATRM